MLLEIPTVQDRRLLFTELDRAACRARLKTAVHAWYRAPFERAPGAHLHGAVGRTWFCVWRSDLPWWSIARRGRVVVDGDLFAGPGGTCIAVRLVRCVPLWTPGRLLDPAISLEGPPADLADLFAFLKQILRATETAAAVGEMGWPSEEN